MSEAVRDGWVSPRVLISYAHDDPGHEERVRRFWTFLLACDVDAQLDLLAANEQQDWSEWMSRELRTARFVVVVASPAYRERAEGRSPAGTGWGVEWEARLLRDLVARDEERAREVLVPVVLPGGSVEDLPDWLTPTIRTHFRVDDFTVGGAEALLRLLTDQPAEVEPPRGQRPVLPPRPLAWTAPGRTVRDRRTEVRISASVRDGELVSEVSMAGSVLGARTGPLPRDLSGVWSCLSGSPARAGGELAAAGRALAGALLDDGTHRLVADFLATRSVEHQVDVVLHADREALGLPVELLRLTTGSGVDLGPLGLLRGTTVRRRVAGLPPGAPAARPGPFKLLAAVAAPEETLTRNRPLDVEAEMQAVLGAVTGVGTGGQVRILEVASPGQIGEALRRDEYHVLHLSAHGTPTGVELEDEDGAPRPATAGQLLDVLVDAGRPAPLVVLSSCSGGSADAEALAGALVAAGADRVLAMQAPVTDVYATRLVAAFYAELAREPQPVAQALGRARRTVERELDTRDVPHRPEWGVATLVCRDADPPLTDASARAPLSSPPVVPSGTSVRELGVGQLIGRRRQVRECLAVLRRTPAAVEEHGAAAGVQLLGMGGIGKTAIAGRVVSRLREDGWVVAVLEGRWNPGQFFASVAGALAADSGAAQRFAAADDEQRLLAVQELLGTRELLVVFDDFEQNLGPGGEGFLDTGFEDVFTLLGRSARAGALLVTCRYPVPVQRLDLVEIRVPPLSPAELRRLFLRLPVLRELPAEDRALLVRTIGGHPRLIEYVDALLRGKPARLPEVQDKLRDLAAREGVDLRRPQPLGAALDRALVLGSADVLLGELLGLLTPLERRVLDQVVVCRAPMDLDDLLFALSPEAAPVGSVDVPGTPADADVAAAVERLADLTLLVPGPGILVHPWTAEQLSASRRDEQHRRALAVRWRRNERGALTYEDLVDLHRHHAALGEYDEVAGLAVRTSRVFRSALVLSAFAAAVRALIPPAERSWILVTEIEVGALLACGDAPAATRLVHRVHSAARRRAEADPDTTEWQRDLSVSHNKLGDLALAAGDGAAARAHYEAGLGIRRRLADLDSGNTEWQRDLSVSHNKLGSLALAVGDGAAARAHYEAGLRIRRHLADLDPGNTRWQRDLSISHDRLGDLALAAGDGAAARTHYEAGLSTARRLADLDPDNTEWQRDLSVSHNKLGNLALAVEDGAAARAHYEAGLGIRRHLADLDPGNTEWQRDLSISHDKLGNLALATGDRAAARTHYEASLTTARHLADLDPGNTEWKRDLSVSHDKLGDLALATGDGAAARTYYEAGLSIRRHLADLDPGNTQWQHDLSVSHDELGGLAVAAGDDRGAADHYSAALAVLQRLVDLDPTNTGWRDDLAQVRDRLAALPRTIDVTDVEEERPARRRW
ncbi:hypothetical protein NUM3379_35960 [Kineococcus sp. NUM-3379]